MKPKKGPLTGQGIKRRPMHRHGGMEVPNAFIFIVMMIVKIVGGHLKSALINGRGVFIASKLPLIPWRVGGEDRQGHG